MAFVGRLVKASRDSGKEPKSKRVQRGGRRRVSLVAFSVALVLAVLVAPAGGAPAGGAGGSKARVAATCGTATAKEVIGGLADAAAGAASLTGPQGFAVGLTVVFFKQFLSLALPDCVQNAPGEDAVSAQLKHLSAQVAALQSHIDKKFLEIQIAETKETLKRIDNAQTNFLLMLKYAGDKDNTSLIDATRKFLNLADALTEAPANLDKDLRKEQEGPGNPLDRPALIPAVRQLLGNERFFTNESSRKIHGFYYYYEWVQTRLAAVLTEYYALGGGCAVIFANSDAHRQELLKSTDCKPVSGEAKRQLDEIQKNIAAQSAMLPPELDSRVAIDRTSKRIWLLNPEVRGNPGILEHGIVREERAGKYRDRYRLLWSPDCRSRNETCAYKPGLVREIGLTKSGHGFPWRFPTAADYQQLFEGGEPLARLNSLGVRRDGKELKGDSADYLWLSGDFYVQECEHCILGKTRPSLRAALYKLDQGGKSPPRAPEFELGGDCVLKDKYDYASPDKTPECRSWNPRVPNAMILWWHGDLTAGLVGKYWCEPGKQPSWDPKDC